MTDHTTYKMTSLTSVSPENAEPSAREIMEKTKSGIGMIPNMYATMANLPAMLATYTFGYDQFRKESGRPTAADVDRFTRAGYREGHILSIILAISVKTISNYSNHVFSTQIDDAFSGRKWT